jgi:hypothetical protein
LKIGKQPISIQVGGKYYADSPPVWLNSTSAANRGNAF